MESDKFSGPVGLFLVSAMAGSIPHPGRFRPIGGRTPPDTRDDTGCMHPTWPGGASTLLPSSTDMGTTTISYADDAYERLKAEKRAGERFSDVVRRLTGHVKLGEFHGVLEEDTGADLAAIVDERRAHRTERRQDRLEGLVDDLA